MPFATKAIRDRARKRVGLLVKAGQPCCFCGAPIDLALPYPAPMSFVVDHAMPTSLGGSDHYDGLRPAHNACNRVRSNSPDGTVGRNSGALDEVRGAPVKGPHATPPRYRNQSGALVSPSPRKGSS